MYKFIIVFQNKFHQRENKFQNKLSKYKYLDKITK